MLEGTRGCQWVVNLANVYSFWEPDRSTYRRVNVEGTRNVMEAALEEGVLKVAPVSTFVVWGNPAQSPLRRGDAGGASLNRVRREQV